MADENLAENDGVAPNAVQKISRNDGMFTPADFLQQKHREFLAAATSENTRRTYRSAVRHFQTWGGVLPCD